MPQSGDGWIETLLTPVFGLGFRLFPIYLLSMVLIAMGVYLVTRPSRPFLAWLFPREIYLHKSHFIDLKLLALTSFVSIFAVLGSLWTTSFTAAGVSGGLAAGAADDTPGNLVIVSLVILFVSDFVSYWVHRKFHETSALWPFHAVHHSAEVLTPVTSYRTHPVNRLIINFARGIAVGLLQGVVLAALVGSVDFATIAGVNVVYVVFHLTGSNLRHSHVWLSYGRVLEHLLISPAQHQIHHSLEPRHRNRNFGEVLAIWDWMFGTLYVPPGPEKLRFGISDDRGTRIPQPHTTFLRALFLPFAESWRAIFGRNLPRQ